MSKSESDSKSRIELLDPPDVIVSKIKKSLTDFTSNVTYDPEKRPGVSNLILIDSLITNKSTETIVNETLSLTTAEYKLQLADRVVEYFKPIRNKTFDLLQDKTELWRILLGGQEKALERAEVTMKEVYKCLGFQ
jgi:tryptophanyl-tRNA synthetase